MIHFCIFFYVILSLKSFSKKINKIHSSWVIYDIGQSEKTQEEPENQFQVKED